MAPPQRRLNRRGSAAAILTREEDYFTFDWFLLSMTYITMGLIFFMFTPYTHQLDEIKNVYLMTLPPVLLALAVWKTDFTVMSWKTHSSTIFLGLYTLIWFLSWLINPRKEIGERTLWFQVGCSTFTVVLAWFMNTENKMRKTMAFFVLVALGSVIVGLFMFAGQGFTDKIYEFMRSSPLWQSRDNAPWVTLMYTLKSSKEMYSTILNSDFYAAYLVMTIPLTLAMFFVEEHLAFKCLAVLTFLLMLVCLAQTNSNDSYLSIVVGIAVFLILGFLFVKNWNLSVPFLITFFCGLVILGITMIILMWPQLNQTWDFKTKAINGRLILWSGALLPWLYQWDPTRAHINIVSFLFGTGPGGYRHYFPVFREANYFDNQINNVTTFGHNYYFDILCETGLLGLTFFLAMFGRVVYDGVQQVRHTSNKSHQFYQIACIAGLLGISVQNITSPNNRWAVCGMIYWAMFGLSMGLHHLDNPGEVKPRAKGEQERLGPVIGRYAMIALAALFLYRSPWQGFFYWKAARENNDGLRFMEYADNQTGTAREDALNRSKGLFEDAIRDNPTFVTSYYKLAHVYNQLGDEDKAIQNYERLNYYNPHYSEIHLNLGIMYSEKSRAQTGAEKQKWLEQSYTEISEAARQEWKPAVQWLAGVIGQDLANYYKSNGQEEKAQKILDEIKPYYWRIIEYKPVLPEYKIDRKTYYPKAQQELLKLANLTGKPEEAGKVLEVMYWENPDSDIYLNGLIAYYDQRKLLKEKTDFLEKAVHSDPTDAHLRKLLADAYNEANDSGKYQLELKRVEKLEPDNRLALKGLYLSYKKSGPDDKAAEYRGKLQKLGVDPDSVTSVPSLAKETSVTQPVVTAQAFVTSAPGVMAVMTSGTTVTAK